jgi:hypothetical protein
VIVACVLFGAAALLMRGRSAAPRPADPRESGGGDEGTELEQMLEDLVTDEPTPGHFYQVQDGDTPLEVALRALGTKATVEDAINYLRCISSGPRYNLPTYATPSTSKSYPQPYMVPGKPLGVRVAFLPRNEDALDLMLRGVRPKMVVNPKTGAPIGTHRHFGLLWLPPVDEVFSCSGYEWEDGSSAIDPPTDLLEHLS